MHIDPMAAEVLRGRVRALFPSGVAVGVARIGETAPLIGPESSGLERMVPDRRGEFIAGRLALRRAQESLGVAAFALPNGADRAPIWPDGYSGSISHAGGMALAVLGRTGDGFRSLGLDIEEDADLPADLHDTILLPCERAALAGCDLANRRARLLFCAKECVYKAQYPLSRRVFGFEVIKVALNSDAFTARFMADVAPFRKGDCLTGRHVSTAGLIIAGMALGATEP